MHAALVPEHLEETPAIGIAFIPAAVLAGLCALALARWPESVRPPRLAALLLLGMIAAYVVAVTVSVPGVEGTPEPVETIAIATKVVELLGFAIAVTLSGGIDDRARGHSLATPEENDFRRPPQAVEEELVPAAQEAARISGEAAGTSLNDSSTASSDVRAAVTARTEDAAVTALAPTLRSESHQVRAALGVGLAAVSLYYLVQRLRH